MSWFNRLEDWSDIWTRYRKYLELHDNWHIQEGTGEQGDALSSYYSDFYHRWWICSTWLHFKDWNIPGISATLGVLPTRHVSGESASVGTQTRSRSGENVLREVALQTLCVTRNGTALSLMRKLRASLAETHFSARKKILIWSAKVILQFLVWGWKETLQSFRQRRGEGLQVQKRDEVEQCCSWVPGLFFNVRSHLFCSAQQVLLS